MVEERLTRIRELITEIEQRETELNQLMGGARSRAPQKCSTCGEAGHTARNCPHKGNVVSLKNGEGADPVI